MNPSSASAATASSINQIMIRSLLRALCAARFSALTRWLGLACLAAVLHGCSTQRSVRTDPPPQSVTSDRPVPGTLERPKARWVPASFQELPGWGADALLQWWPAIRQSCARPAAGWQRMCSQVLAVPAQVNPIILKPWLESEFLVYSVESFQGEEAGLLTGYYEPQIRASRLPTMQYRVPLYQPPSDLSSRQPYWTRQQLDTLPAAQASLKGHEIAWVEDPLDALVLHIQGSGRLIVREPDGREQLVRLAYAGHNGYPYRSVGRWLIEQGLLRASDASWPGIKDWARRNPKRLNELLWQNPRVVFFNEEPLPDPTQGPRGAQGVPLTPERSIAVDPGSIPYGTPVWLDSTDPLSSRPLQRLVVAQDTGSAITGAVRADYFWGWSGEAEAQAGRTRQPLRMWVLWPR
jgi:membrane-bound lytic murein transglycosylase A